MLTISTIRYPNGRCLTYKCKVKVFNLILERKLTSAERPTPSRYCDSSNGRSDDSLSLEAPVFYGEGSFQNRKRGRAGRSPRLVPYVSVASVRPSGANRTTSQHIEDEAHSNGSMSLPDSRLSSPTRLVSFILPIASSLLSGERERLNE